MCDFVGGLKMSGSNSKVIVITSGKGGVGKSTTTANLGVGLSKLGKKVLLIDTDMGLRNLDVVLGLENNIVFDISDVISGICTPNQAIIKDKRFDNLFFLPAAQTKDKDVVTEEDMKQLCDILKKDFDYILIDCPAGIEQGFKNAISGADEAIIVITPDASSIRDADRIVGILEENNLFEQYLLINRIRPDMVRRGYMMNIDDIIEMLGITLIGVIADDEEIIVSSKSKEPVVLNVKSKAGTGYRNVSRRIMGENVPIMDFEEKGLFKKFKKIFS